VSGPATDVEFMRRALELARRAQESGEVPVGALVVHEGAVIAKAGIARCRSRSHGACEIVALRAAAVQLDNYRLARPTLYVTLEPVPCAWVP